MTPRNKAFSPEYKEKCFLAWLAAGSPYHIHDYSVFPDDEFGRKAPRLRIRKWMVEEDWRGRADYVEDKAIEVATKDIINIKADILRKHFEDSVKIAEKALAKLTQDDFDSSASAVAAYFRATEEQRRAVGISEIIEKMTKMTNEELEREILDRIRRATEAGQIIDGEVTDNETSEEDSS